jgi:RNA polymerase sigma factor (sigma-70 family)
MRNKSQQGIHSQSMVNGLDQSPILASIPQPSSTFVVPINYETWKFENKRLIRGLRLRFTNVSGPDVEDAIEAAIELLLNKRINFLKIEEWRAWLFVSSSYCLMNIQKKNSNKVPIEDAMDIGIDDRNMRAFENRDIIEAAFEILSKEDRALLLAKFESGISIAEYARSIGCSPARLNKRQQRALKRIRQLGKKI